MAKGPISCATMEQVSTCNMPGSCSASFSDYTVRKNSKAPVLAYPSCTASSNATADAFGHKPNWTRAQHFSSPSHSNRLAFCSHEKVQLRLIAIWLRCAIVRKTNLGENQKKWVRIYASYLAIPCV